MELLDVCVFVLGRVARAGRTGCAYSLVSPDESAYLLDLHLFLGRALVCEGESKGKCHLLCG